MAPLLGVSAFITILSDGVMIGLLRFEYGTNFLTTGWGISMLVGLFTSILALMLVLAVEVPTGNRLNKLVTSLKGRVSSLEESQRLQWRPNRLVFIRSVWTTLLLIALASTDIRVLFKESHRES